MSAFRLGRALSWRELLLAWAALTVLGVLTYLPHIIHGGFYLDDWSNGALTLYNEGGTGFAHVIESFAETTLFRPVLVLYVPLTYWIFGMTFWVHLAWATLLAIVLSALLYAVLRELDLPWIHALAISGLMLIYPWVDSTRLWITGDQITLATALALGGLWLALIGLSRDSWRWHVGAGALYLASILTYEIALPSIAVFGVIYLWRFGWQRARWRWLADIAVVVVGGAWVLSHTKRTTSGLSDDFTHLRQIIEGGADIVARSLVPVGPARTALPLVLLGLVFAAGAVVWWLQPKLRGNGQVGGLGRWLALGGAGLAVAAFGWVIFIPADPYYTPSIYGMTNRVNGIGGIGSVILVYAAFGVAGTLLARLLRQRGIALGLAVTLVLGALLGVGYLTVMRRHIGIWNTANQAEAVAMSRIKAKYPELPPGSWLITTNYPANQTWGVTILGASWDLDGMVKDEYEDGSLKALPLLPGTGFVCLPNSLAVRALDETGKPTGELMAPPAPYGNVRILDLTTGRATMPADRAACPAAIKGMEPGPLVLSGTY